MKKELIIYSGLIMIIGVLFSFEFMVKTHKQDLPFSSYQTDGINSISFDVPANVYFIQGNESKIILEGSSFTLDQVQLRNKLGHFELKKSNSPSLFSHIQSMVSKDPTINMYVIAQDIESIIVTNQNGCLANNGLFNGDRGILEVDDSDIIQFTRSKKTDPMFIQSYYYFETKAQSISSCL